MPDHVRLAGRVRSGIRHRSLVLASTGALALVLSACVGQPTATPSASAAEAIEAIEAVCSERVVIECTGGDASTVVVVDGDVAMSELSGLVDKLGDARSVYPGMLTLQGRDSDPLVVDADVTPTPRWQLEMPAGSVGWFESTLPDVLTAAEIEGAVDVTVVEGWPYVDIQSIDQFDAAFDALSSTPLFENGGSYTLLGIADRLRIVHVPSRTSDEATHEIVAIARDYPDAEVLLEATTYEPQVPTFYVSRLTPDQVTQVDARLRDARLADADIDGRPLEYVLGSVGADGVTYVNGTFGGVPVG